MRIGDVEIFLINDAWVRTDGGGMFGLVPKVMWQTKYPSDEINRIRMRVNCLLIRDGDRNLVVDTGVGSKMSARTQTMFGIEETGQLPDQLRAQGVDPSQVDMVINTHLHFDHSGGNTIEVEGGLALGFPNATYLVQKGEWEDATHTNERTRASYFPENLLPLRDHGRLELIEGDTQVTPHVRCLLTPGHTPHHQSVLIESGGQKALYLADLTPMARHLERLPWVAAYDLEPMRSIESKRRIQRWVVDEGMLVIFDHDPNVGMGHLRYSSGRYSVEPEPPANSD